MAGQKLTEEKFLELLEKDRKYQEETAKMKEKLKERTKGRIEQIESYDVTVQAFYHRIKVHKKGLELRDKLKDSLDELNGI